MHGHMNVKLIPGHEPQAGF